jgi:hypothetical protein
MQAPRSIHPQTGYPLPPCYYTLYTAETKTDQNSPTHFVFTPPPSSLLDNDEFFRYDSPEPLSIRQFNCPEIILYNIPQHIPDEYRSAPNTGALTRYHPDVDYKGELIKLNKLLAQEYGYLLQSLSSPQPPTHNDNRPLLFEEHSTSIGVILSNITHLTALLREHQAKEQILSHVKLQTRLNQDKVKKLNQLREKFQIIINATDREQTDVIMYDTMMTVGNDKVNKNGKAVNAFSSSGSSSSGPSSSGPS